MTHYDVLGLGAEATPAEIRGAYRRAARRTHPDTGGDPTQFAAVQAAWEALSSPAARDAYDRELAGDLSAPDPGWGTAVGFDDLEPDAEGGAASDPSAPSPAAPPPGWPDPDAPGDDPVDLAFDTYTSEPRVLPVFHVDAPTDPEGDRRAGPRERAARWTALGSGLGAAALLGLFAIPAPNVAATDLGGMLVGVTGWSALALGVVTTRANHPRTTAVLLWALVAATLLALTLIAAHPPALVPAARTLRALTLAAHGVALTSAALATSASLARRGRRVARAARHHQELVDLAYRDHLARHWNAVLAAASAPGTALWWLDSMTLTGHVRTAHAWDPRTRTWAHVVVPDVAEPRTWVVLDPARVRVLAVAQPGADEAWSDTFAMWAAVRAAV